MQEPSNLIRMPDNVYDESALSDLYTGASLELAIAQYKDAIATSCTKKEAFRFTVWSIERMHRKIGVNEDEDVVLPSYEDTVNDILKNGPDPKTRLFTPEEMAIAIEFFTRKQIPIERVISWGQGVDPYWNGEE